METSKDSDSFWSCLSLITGWVCLLPDPPRDVASILFSSSSLASFSFLLSFLVPSVPFLGPSFSAQCNSTYLCRPFGGPPFFVAVDCRHNADSSRGSPSLSSGNPCWGGAYYCFPSSSSYSSCAHTCASAFGHRGANHQCSHRPAWYPHGSPRSGTGHRWTNPAKKKKKETFKDVYAQLWTVFNSLNFWIFKCENAQKQLAVSCLMTSCGFMCSNTQSSDNCWKTFLCYWWIRLKTRNICWIC